MGRRYDGPGRSGATPVAPEIDHTRGSRGGRGDADLAGAGGLGAQELTGVSSRAVTRSLRRDKISRVTSQ